MPIVTLSELAPTSVDWIWPGWLAGGVLHVLDGDPGVGKSMVTADLAARISTGRGWADGSGGGGAQAVILLNAEDDAGSTTRGRVAALGGDLGRIHAWTIRGEETPPLLPGGIGALREAVERVRPRLVVIDPITAFLEGSVAFHQDPAIRRALRPLGNLASERRCAILMVRHLTKRVGQRSLYRGLGSIGMMASCRIAWLAAGDPDVASRGVLSVQKTNFGVGPGSLAYAVGENASAVPLTWLGPATSAAAELLDSRRVRPRVRARRLLAELLKDGPRTSAELHAAIGPHHVKWRTLRRAAKELDVDIRTIGNQFVGKTAYWLLPGQRVPAGALEAGSVDEWIERTEG